MEGGRGREQGGLEGVDAMLLQISIKGRVPTARHLAAKPLHSVSYQDPASSRMLCGVSLIHVPTWPIDILSMGLNLKLRSRPSDTTLEGGIYECLQGIGRNQEPTVH